MGAGPWTLALGPLARAAAAAAAACILFYVIYDFISYLCILFHILLYFITLLHLLYHILSYLLLYFVVISFLFVCVVFSLFRLLRFRVRFFVRRTYLRIQGRMQFLRL